MHALFSMSDRAIGGEGGIACLFPYKFFLARVSTLWHLARARLLAVKYHLLELNVGAELLLNLALTVAGLVASSLVPW